jgi:hypothetical protein
MKIAVIPARSGSKRIPRKNIKPFRGKPMIAWSIEAARESGLFEHIVVSTDDAEIAAVARQFGAEVPFTRPAELSDDHAGTIEVVAHATKWAFDQHWPVPTPGSALRLAGARVGALGLRLPRDRFSCTDLPLVPQAPGRQHTDVLSGALQDPLAGSAAGAPRCGPVLLGTTGVLAARRRHI